LRHLRVVSAIQWQVRHQLAGDRSNRASTILEAGDFVFNLFPPHRHSVRVEAAGLKSFTVPELRNSRWATLLAARHAVATVEEVVDDFGPRSSNAVIVPACSARRVAVVRIRVL
jgi:hypothetical protein